MSKKPPRLFVSELTESVYVSSAYEVTNKEKGHVNIKGATHDVTDQFHFMAKKLGYIKSEELNQGSEDDN